MFGSLRKKLEETAAQINPFDGGKTAATVRANRNQAPPAQTIRSQPKQNSLVGRNDNQPGFQITNNSFTRGLSRGFDQANMFDNNRTWQQRTPTGTQSIGQEAKRIVNTPTTPKKYWDNGVGKAVNTAIAGTNRAAAGIGQDLGGLVDYVTPGKGTNRVTSYFRDRGAMWDDKAKEAGVDGLGYKVLQVPLNVASYMVPGSVAKGVGSIPRVASTGAKVANIASKTPGVSSVLSAGAKLSTKLDDIAKTGNIAQRTGARLASSYMSKPAMADVAFDTIQSAGSRTSKGQDNSFGTLAVDTGLSLATQGGVNLAGQALKPVTTRLVQTAKNLPSPAQVTTRLAGASRKIDETLFTPRLNRLDLDTRDALIAYSDRLVGADPYITGKVESDLIKKVRAIGDANGVDLTNGTVVQQLDRIEALLNGYKGSSGALNSKPVPVDPLEALKQEARKYKSAEEFVKAYGEPVYHGTTEKIVGDFKYPLYTTPKKDYAQVFADSTAASSISKSGKKLSDAPMVHEFAVNPKARVLDITNPTHRKLLEEQYFGKYSMSYDPIVGKNGHIDWTEGENLAEWVDENKLPFDAIKLDEGGGGIDPSSGLPVIDKGVSYMALNNNALRSKQQLTDLYNQSKPSIKDKVKNSLKSLNEDQGGGYDGGRSATDRATSLKQEARKYKSAEEFIGSKNTPSFELDKTRNQSISNLAEAARNAKSFEEFANGTYELPLKDLHGNTPRAANTPGKSRTPNAPVEAYIRQGRGVIDVTDGNHRLYEAADRGEQTIKVRFNDTTKKGDGYWGRLKDFYEEANGRKLDKQQLTDLYNQSKPSIKDKVKNSLKSLNEDQGGGYDGGRSATDRATSLKQEARKQVDNNTIRAVKAQIVDPKLELWQSWFQKADSNALPAIKKEIDNNPILKDVGATNLYEYYKQNLGNKQTFEQFMDSDITLYRGGNTNKLNELASYTPIKRKAERFGDVTEITIKPKDTYGILGDFSEGEVFIPAKSQLTDLYSEATKPSIKDKVKNSIKSLNDNEGGYVKVPGKDPLESIRQEASYRSAHQINSKTARNLGDMQSVDDVVAQIKSKYGLTNYDQKDITNLRKIVGNPEADVKIYRASPVNEINDGDWVTTSKTYAQDIKRQNGGKVYEYTVKAKDLNLPENIEDNPSLARFSAFQYITDSTSQKQSLKDKVKNSLKSLNEDQGGGYDGGRSATDRATSLKQEARKYKSAEEFVKAKTNQYHGTLDNNYKLDPNNRLFLTGDSDSASTYAGRRYNQDPEGKVIGYHAKDGKTLDLNDNATREKYVRDVLGQDKQLKKYYDRIPESLRKDYFDTLGWAMKEYEAGRIPKADLDKYTQAQKNYKNISSKDVYANWDKIIARAKKDGYDYIKHTTEDPSAEITFPETVALNPSKSLLDDKQLTDLYNQATQPQPPKSTPVQKVERNGKPLAPKVEVPTGFSKSLEDAGLAPSENLTKKVKTVYDTDKQLRDISTTKKQIVDAQAGEILQGSRGDLLNKVLKEGGISSSAYESLPKGVKRNSGMSADKMAQVLGFEDEDAFVKALQNEAGKPKITKAQARAEAEEMLNTGKSPYAKDYKEVLDAETARKDELYQYPVTSKVVDKPTQTMDEADWNSLAQTPEANNPRLKTRQSVAKATSELKEAQKEAVVSGDIKKSQELREKIGEIEKGTKRTPPDLNKRAEEIIPDFEIKDIRGKSNKEVKKAFMERANNYLGSRKAAEFSSIDKARQFNEVVGDLSEKQKLEVIRATDDPTYKSKDKAVQNAVEKLHEQYDEAYKYFTKDKNIDMGYQHSYYPRMYKNPQNGELMSGAEFNLLQRGSARQKGRTADLVAEDFLVTKDPAEALTMYHRTLENAAAGKKFLDDLEQDGFIVKSQEVVRGMRPVIAEGMQTDGMIYYAKPEVAKSLDRLFGTQEASGVFEKLVEKGQGLNSFFQSIVLSGGIPNTPVNAFGFMQVMKSTMAGHPIQAGKAFLKSISRDSTDKFFKQNSDILQLMSKYGLDTRVAYDAKRVSAFKKIGESFKESKAKGLTEAWDQITNDATFQRFMPMLETMHFKNVYNGLSKKMPAEQAAKIAAESTSNFFGKTKIAQQATRSKVASDFAGATLFAPRFRESMINFWVKNAQSLKPGNIGKKEFRDNQKFMVSAALVWGAMESANMALNGNWMHDNPDGKKDKLLIPGVTDDGKTIGVPFLPSIATVPRNLAMGVFNTLSGNFEEAGKNAQSFLSMPLKTATEIGTNENYFGQRIVDEDGTTPDKISQMASHIAKNNMQPWVREGLNIAGQNLPEDVKKTLGIKKKSGFETASNALESPLRFYDPAYFKGGTGKLAAQSKFRGDGTTPITEKTEKNKAGKYTSRDKYDAIIDAYSKQDGEVKTSKYDTKELQKAVKDIEAEIKQEFGRYSGIKDMKFNSNRAIEYAKYKKGLVGKNKIEADKLTKSFVKGLYNSQLKGIEQDIYTLAEDDLKGYYERGEITDQNLSNALAVEKQLFDNGLIDKETLARKLDLNARGYKTAKSGGGGGRRGRSKAGYDYTKALFDANVGSVSMTKDLQSILEKYMKANAKISKKA